MYNKIWSQIKEKGNNYGVNLLLLSGITLGSLLLSPQSSYAAPFKLTQTFNDPTPNNGSRFGWSVAISDNNILVGDLRDDTGALGAGAAHLFDGSTGSLLHTFQKPTPTSNGDFGFSVAISGNNVLVGARFDKSNAGTAYLFDGSTGSLLRTFQKPTPSIYDQFGYSVAVSGNNILVGEIITGAAYLFDGTTGSLLQTFLKPTPAFNQFGNSVAISGNKVLVGASYDNTGATAAGVAYLFDGTTGSLLQTFLNPTPENSDLFGYSVSISGNNVLIGTPNDSAGASNAGSAYLFDATSGSLLQTFLNPTPAISQSFGQSVAISNNNVLVGAPNGGNGTAYLFDATTGSLLQTFLDPTPLSGGSFGFSVAISNDNALIGEVGGRAAYLFHPAQSSKTVPEPSNMLGLSLLGLGLAATKVKGVLSKKAKSPTDNPQATDS
jgi:hypothetical protein